MPDHPVMPQDENFGDGAGSRPTKTAYGTARVRMSVRFGANVTIERQPVDDLIMFAVLAFVQES